MPIDELPATGQVPTRDEVTERWLRSYRIRHPGADTGPGTEPHASALVRSDILNPLYDFARRTSLNTVLEQSQGEALKQWGARYGIEGPNQATGSRGFVSADTSVGGAQIVAGLELVHEASGQVFEATRTKKYLPNESVAIQARSTGPSTNLPAGTALKWRQTVPGLNPVTFVVAQPNGDGLVGGRRAETGAEYQERIRQHNAEPEDSGNEAEYIGLIEDSRGHTIPVLKGFAYSASNGTGTASYAFLVTPTSPFGSRIPSALQRSEVESYVVGKMPGDDGAFFVEVLEETADVAYRVTWARNSEGWSDLVPWPTYFAPSAGKVVVQTAASPTNFTLRKDNDNYAGAVQPQVGQTIAFFDRDTAEFRRKRILSFTGTGPWVITCDITNDASDQSYQPLVGQPAMPWSESLQDMVAPLAEYFGRLGTGEIVSTFYDEGRRLRRQPLAPNEWPHTLSNRALGAALEIDAINDGTVVEGDGVGPTVGTPGTLVRVLRLRFLSVLPE